MRLFRWSLLLVLVVAICLVSGGSALAGAIATGPNVRITDAGLNGASIDHVRMVEHEGTLYAVWEDGRDGTFAGIYFAKSPNGGESWGPNIRVTLIPDDDWVNHPDIAVQPDGTIWVVWHRFYDADGRANDIMLAKSTDGGDTFAVSRLLDGANGDENFWRTRIVADASNSGLYILTQLYGVEDVDEGMDILFGRYDEASGEWLGDILNDAPRAGRIDTGIGNDYGAWLSLTARDGIVCAAWEDRGRNTSERQPIYGACSTDGGVNFGSDFKISEDDGIHPEIALGPTGELYAAYALDTDTYKNIKLRHSTDLGVTWGPTRPVSAVDSSEISNWVIGVDANGQVLIPYTHRNFNNLYLATSIDQGQNFSLLPLYDGTGQYPNSVDHYDPALAVSGTGDDTRAYVAWEDDRASDHHLWSQRIILDSLPPSTPTGLTIAPQERALRLSWQASTDTNGVAGYRVYRATNANGPFALITPRLVRATSYVDVELDGATYFYKVAAVDGTGNTSPQSAAVNAAATVTGDPTFDGRIAYETGNNIRLRNLTGDPAERTLTEARQPRFSNDGESIYYLSQQTIWSQPVGGGDSEGFFANDNLFDYDLAADEAYYAIILGRNFVAPGAVGGFCYVTEPNYGRPGQNIYTEQYDLASDIALSNDRKWMVYRTAGWCNVASVGSYFPPKLCLVDLTNDPANNDPFCLEGYEYRTPDFAPTGHWMAFSADFTGQEEIWKAQVQPNGSLDNFAQLSRGPADQPSRAPSWSTDGNWIIFQRDLDPGEGEDWRLYVVRADGVGLRSLELAGEEPAWLGGGPTAPTDPTGSDTLHLPSLKHE